MLKIGLGAIKPKHLSQELTARPHLMHLMLSLLVPRHINIKDVLSSLHPVQHYVSAQQSVDGAKLNDTLSKVLK